MTIVTRTDCWSAMVQYACAGHDAGIETRSTSYATTKCSRSQEVLQGRSQGQQDDARILPGQLLSLNRPSSHLIPTSQNTDSQFDINSSDTSSPQPAQHRTPSQQSHESVHSSKSSSTTNKRKPTRSENFRAKLWCAVCLDEVVRRKVVGRRDVVGRGGLDGLLNVLRLVFMVTLPLACRSFPKASQWSDVAHVECQEKHETRFRHYFIFIPPIEFPTRHSIRPRRQLQRQSSRQR